MGIQTRMAAVDVRRPSALLFAWHHAAYGVCTMVGSGGGRQPTLRATEGHKLPLRGDATTPHRCSCPSQRRICVAHASVRPLSSEAPCSESEQGVAREACSGVSTACTEQAKVVAASASCLKNCLTFSVNSFIQVCTAASTVTISYRE